LINKAISKFDSMTPEKKRKVARLLGLPVTEDSKEDFVYNQVDNILKQTEFKSGKYQGLSTIEVFNRFADMKENLLHIKDLVKQAIAHSVYRVKSSGRVFEGEFELTDCGEFLDTYTLDRLVDESATHCQQNSIEVDVNRNAVKGTSCTGSDPDEAIECFSGIEGFGEWCDPCYKITLEVEDNWPSTITVTLS